MARYLLFTCLLVRFICRETSSFQFPSLPIITIPSSWGENIGSFKTKKQVSTTELLDRLEILINQAPKNGIDTPLQLESQISSLCQELEGVNPTRSPARSDLMNGFWKMRWTNFSPAAPSSGKLGPLIGTVYQNLDLPQGAFRNILQIDFPPIAGELFASPQIVNDSTVAITFVSVGNKLAGIIPFGPKIQFEEGKEVRLWEHVYLDDKYRILYARRQQEAADNRGFLYVMKRAEDERFETNV
jgi:hypothetical protein